MGRPRRAEPPQRRVLPWRGSTLPRSQPTSFRRSRTATSPLPTSSPPAWATRRANTSLGAGRAYTGLDADLRGDDARLDIDTRYLGHASQQRDFNYVAHQRGRRTVCNLDANGVLEGESEKTLRGTIELVHGCKGSVGSRLAVARGIEIEEAVA